MRKIKRKTALYKKSRINKNAAGTLLFILLISALLVLGYFIGSAWSKRANTDFDDNSSTPNPVTSNASSDATSQSSSSEQAPSSNIVNPQGTYITAFMPYTAYEGKSEAVIKQWMATKKTEGYNSVAVELKDEAGIIHYNSANAMAAEYKAVSKNPTELAVLVKAITSEGMYPIGLMSTLKDKTAPSLARENSYAFDTQLDVNWWDNSAANGGKPWLNPYMQNTRTYIKGLCDEIASAGFKQIYLSNVMFPDKNTEKMNVITETMSRENILKKIVEDSTSDKAFAVYAYFVAANDVDITAKITSALQAYESSVPLIKQAELNIIKPILTQLGVDDYVVY